MTKDLTPDSSVGLSLSSPINTDGIRDDTFHDILSPVKPEKQDNIVPEKISKICEDGASAVESKRAELLLSEGLLSHYATDCKKIQGNLKELVKSQNILLETVQQENARFLEMKTQYSLDEIFTRSRQYHAKLMQIKKDMAALTEKAAKLKRRSLRLQEQKQREALQKEQSREREIEKEKQILAKVAAKP